MGSKLRVGIIFSAYDESKLKFVALEGSAFFTTHSLITAANKEYIPITFLSFYFYSRSSKFVETSSHFKYSEDVERDANFDYVVDRNRFLNNTWAADNSILFIDGPLIGGNLSSYTIALVENLHRRNIIPVFVIKNSDSNLVTDNFTNLKGKFNSDLHWSFNYLDAKQRSNFFQYTDENNPRNSKVFCYVKVFNRSPQRIEFHVDTFNNYRDNIKNLLDLVCYLILVQGGQEKSSN